MGRESSVPGVHRQNVSKDAQFAFHANPSLYFPLLTLLAMVGHGPGGSPATPTAGAAARRWWKVHTVGPAIASKSVAIEAVSERSAKRFVLAPFVRLAFFPAPKQIPLDGSQGLSIRRRTHVTRAAVRMRLANIA
jgi:hypothetical protein